MLGGSERIVSLNLPYCYLGGHDDFPAWGWYSNASVQRTLFWTFGTSFRPRSDTWCISSPGQSVYGGLEMSIATVHAAILLSLTLTIISLLAWLGFESTDRSLS